MQNEIRQCQNCSNKFVVEQEDFNFYEKIKVPPPTFCPECRTVRRLCFRNEMSLFKRKCDADKHTEQVITIYHPEEKITVYDLGFWWGDSWDPMIYGKEYDFSKSFFEQWRNLRNVVPQQAISNSKAVNSEYCNVAEDSKDSYMSSASYKIEKTFYSNRITSIKDSSDLYVTQTSEFCYDDVFCSDCYHVLYSYNCKSCMDSYFLYDCHGCNHCFGCTNLRSKSYCMWNKQLSREEYEGKIKEYKLDDYEQIQELKKEFQKIYLKAIHRFANQIRVYNSTGDNLEGAKNCKESFDVMGEVENVKYFHWGLKVKDSYDAGPGMGIGELFYEVFDGGVGTFQSYFTNVVYSSTNAQYSFYCYNCNNIFGCIGLRNKNYCILNKQYSKEEYEILVSKIKKHMDEKPYIDKRGIVYKYGEFFPVELSTFCYNETQAQDYFPLTKEEALRRGYKWRDRNVNEYKISIKAEDLPNSLKSISGSITQEIIACLHGGKCKDRCSGAFKITEEELRLYKRIGVPLPRLCFGCRHDARLRIRNPLKLWHRKCMKEGCSNEFETSFAPDRPEIIYCEKCYQQEVY